jgi:hypothetical protein
VRSDSIFDLKNKNQFMEMDVYLGDQLPHFKFVTDSMIWHFMLDYQNVLGFYSFSGDCSKGKLLENYNNSNSDSDFEELRDE